jgi:hypothetical protein
MAKCERNFTMNLEVLKKSRRSQIAGDIFVMRPPDDQFLYGRVIDPAVQLGAMGPCVLFYVYSARSAQRLPVPELLCTELLVPPMFTNRLPWSRGYFEHVETRPIRQRDVLPQHCFRNVRGELLDERGGRVPGPVEPVGAWGLESYRTIDDEVSRALGIPLAPD